MKTIIAMSLLLTVVFHSCTRLEIEKEVPTCVKNEIVAFDREQKCDDIHVDEYTFQGATVYVFSIGHTCGADMQNSVIDSNCHVLGALGGIAGINEINGELFSNAEFVKTVWKK